MSYPTSHYQKLLSFYSSAFLAATLIGNPAD